MTRNSHVKLLPPALLTEKDRSVVVAELIHAGHEPLPDHVKAVLEQPEIYMNDDRLVKVVYMVRRWRETKRPISLETIGAQLEALDYFDGDPTWFSKLASYGGTIWEADLRAERLIEEYYHREVFKALEKIIDERADLTLIESGVNYLSRVFDTRRNQLTKKELMPQLRSIGESMTSPLPLRDPVVHGVLRRGDIMTINGPPKACKTWNLAALGLCTHAGRDWFGHRTEKIPVLYCNFEVHASDWDRRLITLCEALQVDPDPHYFYSLNCRGYDTTHSMIFPMIRELTRERHFGLVIVDPSYLLYDEEMEENSNADISRLLRYVTGIAAPGNFAVAFGGHFAKGNAASRSALDRQSGANTWARYPDCIASITPLKDDSDEYALEFILRSYAAVPRRFLRWEYPIMKVDDSVTPEEVAEMISKKGRGKTKQGVEKNKKPMFGPEFIAGLLPRMGTFDVRFPEKGVRTAMQLREALIAQGCPKSEVANVLQTATDAGVIQMIREKKQAQGSRRFYGHPDTLKLFEDFMQEQALQEAITTEENRLDLKRKIKLAITQKQVADGSTVFQPPENRGNSDGRLI